MCSLFSPRMSRGEVLLRQLNNHIARFPPKHLSVQQPALDAALSRTNSPACLPQRKQLPTLYCDDVTNNAYDKHTTLDI